MAKYLIGNIKGPKGDQGPAGKDGPTYTAGEGITIENNVISATGSGGGGITTETDPVFSASPAANITNADIQEWDAKSDFSGSYNDLTNKPDLSQFATQTQLGTGLARKQDVLTAGDNITIENNVISATGGSGSSYDDTDVANYIKNTFGMGVTEEETEEVYIQEYGASGSEVSADVGGNPPATIKVYFNDSSPGLAFIAEYTLNKTSSQSDAATYTSENNEVRIEVSQGPSWTGTMYVPASIYEQHPAYDYKIYNPEGGTQTVYSKLNSEFIKVDHNTIGFTDGALVAYTSGGSSLEPMDNDILTWDSNPSGISAQSVLGATKSQQDVYTTVVSITSELTNVDEQYNQTWSNVPINVNSLAAGTTYHYAFNDSMYGLSSSNDFYFDPNPEMGDNGLTFYDEGPAGYFTLKFNKDSNDEWIVSEINVNGEDWRTVGETITLTFSSISQQTAVNPINTEFIPIDNSTITINNDGKLQAVSSGGSAAGIYELTDLNTTGKDDLLAMFANGNQPEVILYNNIYYKIADRLLNFSGTILFNYVSKYDKDPITGPEFLQFRCALDYSSFTSINTQSGNTLNGNSITVRSAPADKFPDASSKTLAVLFNSIGNNYAANNHAVNKIQLKDANDVVYDITVGTDGTLTATAVSNS